MVNLGLSEAVDEASVRPGSIATASWMRCSSAATVPSTRSTGTQRWIDAFGPSAVDAADGPFLRGAGGLEQVRRDRRGEDDAAQALGAVPADVTGDLATTHGVTDERDVQKVDLLEDRVQVLGEAVVAVSGQRLVAAPGAATIAGDDPVADLLQRRHLQLGGLAGHRPAVDQHHRTPGPPVSSTWRSVFVKRPW